MDRRQFIQAGSAASVLGVAAGCASTGGGSGAGGNVVVVGGGYGGATAAKYVRMWSEGRVNVTLVEPNDSFISCPISNLVIGGSKQMADITTPYDNLAKRHGVKIIRTARSPSTPASAPSRWLVARCCHTTAWCCRLASNSCGTRCPA